MNAEANGVDYKGTIQKRTTADSSGSLYMYTRLHAQLQLMMSNV